MDRAWALPPSALSAQTEAAAELALRAGRMGLQVAAMNDYPVQSVRFLRLVARHWDALPEEAREAACGAAQWADYAHPEAADLVIEAVRTGDATLNTALGMAMQRGVAKELTRTTNVSARLARVLDEGPTDAARREALFRLHAFGRRDAVPALRRVLRRPHFGVRWRALQILDRRFADAVDAGDALFLLEEAVSRPLPPTDGSRDNTEGTFEYPDLLDRAICRTRPAGGAALLVRILEGACAGGYRWGFLDGRWAMGVLGEAYPEEALPHIDRRFRHVEWDRRQLATIGAARLPDELAWPRLLLAAEDPVPELSESARDVWLKRRGAPCPVAELAGIDAFLLVAPPSERLLARLGVFRRGPLPARAGMVAVLLREAPDPEALALLAFAIGDSAVWERSGREGLPRGRKELVREMVRAWRARGVLAVLGRAERHPEGRWGWLDSLADVVTAKGGLPLPEECHSAVRAAAARRLAEATEAEYAVMSLLAVVGPPPEATARLCAVAWDPQVEDYLRDAASAALGALRPTDLATLTDAELSAALAAKDVPRLVRAALAGIRGGSARAILLAEQAFERHAGEPPDDPAITDALDECVKELLQKRHLPEGRVLAGLDAPGTNAFVVATRRLRRDGTPEARAKLLAALDGDAVCAAAAAIALLFFFPGAIAGADPRLHVIAARVPPRVRAGLFWHMFYHAAPTAALWPLIEEVLVSPDPAVTGEFSRRVDSLLDAGMEDRIRAIESRIVDPKIRGDIERWRTMHKKESAPYWEDGPADEEEEEEGAEGGGAEGREDDDGEKQN